MQKEEELAKIELTQTNFNRPKEDVPSLSDSNHIAEAETSTSVNKKKKRLITVKNKTKSAHSNTFVRVHMLNQ